ncbi:CaiB/BaiF CoA transferase family protein [Roseibium sp.]|uniref:CaiB/BaiF CoA transferase family protein n=1 Tax=Roseibium sp. TaxID=1936156 RepID=UPI003A97F6AE
MTGVLGGLRVLDFSRFLPGPYCTWLLADQGAEVIRVEHPRELKKQAKVFGWDKLDPEQRARQRARDILARGKKSLLLDIGNDSARTALLKLAATVDVVVEDYRPGVLESLGLGYGDLSRDNPGLVYTSLTLCGQTGPYRDKPGHDPVALSLSGVLSRTGEDPAAPSLMGVAAADVTTGSHAAFATLAAVMHARATGKGQHVDVAMADCSFSLVANLLSRYENPEGAPPRGTRRTDLGLWQCADGKWLCTTDMEPRYWEAFCTAMGKPEFIPWQLRTDKAPEIRTALAQIFETQPRSHWLRLLEAAGTQFAPVNSVSEALQDPHFRARGMVIEVEAPDGKALRQIGAPVRLANAQHPTSAVMPGTHNAQVLSGIGMSATEVAALDEDQTTKDKTG